MESDDVTKSGSYPQLGRDFVKLSRHNLGTASVQLVRTEKDTTSGWGIDAAGVGRKQHVKVKVRVRTKSQMINIQLSCPI